MVGSSGTYPIAGRPGSGYLVEQGSTRIWCDTGPGTFTGLPVDSDLIDAVVVSHQHPDHSSDLFTAFHAWTYRPDPRLGVPLYAPAAVWERVSSYLEKGQGSALDACFDFNPVWSGDVVEVGEIRIAFTEMDHSVPTVGTRWEGEGRTLFYTADTGPAGDWTGLAEGVDLMLSEASYQGEPGDGVYPHHLTATQAGRIARDTGSRRLVLTHIPPYLDPARSVHEAELVFDRPVALAVPGSWFDV